MSKGLNIESVVGGVVKEELIDNSSQTSFLVTFQTNACEEGHVIWLSKNFESWGKEIKKIPGVLDINHISVTKAFPKGKKGVISVGIVVKGALSGAVHAKDTSFWANLVNTTRKTLAENVLKYFSPNFDFKNPLFDALHVHQYVLTPCCSDWKIGEKRLNDLIENIFDFGRIIDDCGAMLVDPKVVRVEKTGMTSKVSITLRWKQNAMESQRETLEKVIKAFFRGMGFDAENLKIKLTE